MCLPVLPNIIMHWLKEPAALLGSRDCPGLLAGAPAGSRPLTAPCTLHSRCPLWGITAAVSSRGVGSQWDQVAGSGLGGSSPTGLAPSPLPCSPHC